MPIKPEQVNSSKLPGALRGYDRDATDELLRRVAWDYLQAERAHTTAVEETETLRARVHELEAELASQRDGFDRELRERTAVLEAQLERVRGTLREHEARDEMTRRLLESAQRSARELRESTRTECESLIKAAHRRAVEIEAESRAAVRHSLREIDRLTKLERDLKAQLRTMLESVIGTNNAEQAPAPVAEPVPSAAVQ
jgi:cell division septum initiation protein DivIVA